MCTESLGLMKARQGTVGGYIQDLGFKSLYTEVVLILKESSTTRTVLI